MAIPQRPFKDGISVSILGLGGFTLGVAPDFATAQRIVDEALDCGLTFFDNAWEYNQGKSEEWMGRCLAGKRDRAFVMTKVCTHGRDKRVALQQLDESLRRLRTDRLDLWQVHEVVWDTDPERHYAPGGVLEALDEAKAAGKVRYVGFTGHKDPRIHLDMINRGYPFDTVQLPLNPFDVSFHSFQRFVLPELARHTMHAIGMKSLQGNARAVKDGVATAEELLRYAMSVPGVLTTVSGMDSLEVARQNLAIAERFSPMDEAQRRALEERLAPHAIEGAYELFKSTRDFDADEGRVQHGFPKTTEKVT